jgi:hypothetical protein
METRTIPSEGLTWDKPLKTEMDIYHINNEMVVPGSIMSLNGQTKELL